MLNPSPNQKQKEAISHPPAPLMILAGAGTGKTFTLESRIIYLIQHYRINPTHILAITYTEKAARELKNRVIKQVGQAAQNLTMNTFHSFCFKILKDYNTGSIPQLLDESEAIHLFLERFDELGPFESNEYPLDPQKAITGSFIPFFNRMRDELINPVHMSIPEPEKIGEEIGNQLRDLKRIYPLFQKWKQKMNVIDYGDMILSTYELLQSNNGILEKIQDQYQNIIIDEFQDNNYALNEIIGLISQKRKQITVVGDDDQVIYSFRGANMYNIKGFQKRYSAHKQFKYVALDDNYRSSQAILDLANSSIQNNIDRMEKSLNAKQGYENLKPIRFWGEKESQIAYLIQEIKNYQKESIQIEDIAVLCRTHSQRSLITSALKKAGIPIIPRYSGLFAIKEVRDIIAWSQVIGNGIHAESSLYRIIRNKCGYEVIHRIYSKFNKRDTKSRYELILKDLSIFKQYPQVKIIFTQIKELKRNLSKQSAAEMIWDIVEAVKLLKVSSQNYTLNDHYILLNIGNLLKRSQDFTKRNNNNFSLKAFNLYLEAVMRTGGLPSIPPPSYRARTGVNVNTIHGVKGGEFPIVFLPFLRSASFPLNYRTEKIISKPPDDWLKYDQNNDLTNKEHHLQEERRLFYVAITRAKKKLHLLVPPKATSKLVKELPDTLMEDQMMEDSTIILNSYSDLKIKYENLLQNALSREMYEEVINMTKALSIIKDYENGNSINLGNQKWELKLKEELAKPFEPDIPEVLNLSASAIDTYESCPLKFRMGRIDGIPQNAKKPELTFGNIIHAALQRFHEADKDLTKDRILRLLEEEWKKGEFDYTVREEKFKEQGIHILSMYVDNITQSPPNVLKTEEQFSFDIGHITIRGAIDRLDKIGGGIGIVDYKTSKSTSSAKNNLQLAIYSMYLEQLDDPLLGGLPVEASLYFLRDDEKPIRSHTFTSDQIATTKEKIIEVAAGIRNKDFSPKTGRHCDWCDYKALACPAWENS